MDAADLSTLLGLPGSTAHVDVARTADGREVVLVADDLTLTCPWQQPDDWNGATVVLPWYDTESLFADLPPDPRRPFVRTKFSVATDLLARGFGIVAIPWWAEELAISSPERNLADRYGAPAAAALEQGWSTGLGRSMRDVLTVVETIDPDAGRLAILGHSLGGKLALFAAALDPRLSACVTHELGLGWDHSNWFDPWYFGEVRPDVDCDQILALVAPRPVLYGAGHGFDGDEGIAMARSVATDDWQVDILEHHNGHRPSPEALADAYTWLYDHTRG
ncbi:MAG TPA: hypothetical protein IAA98_16015 [Candidatus Avipropionibacterium avicola]|uniref:Alpha/beta hydrolase n=1 Tax=Candidatus Avipropionibacterium avicola TaxID=2840701 RepID=A0A9D1KNU6_9ACTN|nr:hypothetical protein [Candidatus Avipropionibacterium avicola]